jgi:hypothetical protein
MANVVAKATGYKNGQKNIPKLLKFSGGENENFPAGQWLGIAEMQSEDFLQTKDRKEWVKVAAFHLRPTSRLNFETKSINLSTFAMRRSAKWIRTSARIKLLGLSPEWLKGAQ